MLTPNTGAASEHAIAVTVCDGEYLTAVGQESGYLSIYHGTTLVAAFQSGIISNTLWVGDTLICTRGDTILRYVCTTPAPSPEAYPHTRRFEFEPLPSTRVSGRIVGIDYSVHGLAYVAENGLLYFATNQSLTVNRPFVFCPPLCVSEVEGRQGNQTQEQPQSGVLAGGIARIAWATTGCQLAVCCPAASVVVVLYLTVRTAPEDGSAPIRPMSEFKISQASYLKCGPEGSLRSFEFYPGRTPSGNAMVTAGLDGTVRIWAESATDRHYHLVHGMSRTSDTVATWLVDQNVSTAAPTKGLEPEEEQTAAPFGMNSIHSQVEQQCVAPAPDTARALNGSEYSSPTKCCLVLQDAHNISLAHITGLCAVPRRGVSSTLRSVKSDFQRRRSGENSGASGNPAYTEAMNSGPPSERVLCFRSGVGAGGQLAMSYVTARQGEVSLYSNDGKVAVLSQSFGGDAESLELHPRRDVMAAVYTGNDRVVFWSAGDARGVASLASPAIGAYATSSPTYLCSFDVKEFVQTCLSRALSQERNIRVKRKIISLKTVWHPTELMLYCAVKVAVAVKGGAGVDTSEHDVLFSVELKTAAKCGTVVDQESDKVPQNLPATPGSYIAQSRHIFAGPAEAAEAAGFSLLGRGGAVAFPSHLDTTDHEAIYQKKQNQKEKEKETKKNAAEKEKEEAPMSEGKSAAMNKYAFFPSQQQKANAIQREPTIFFSNQFFFKVTKRERLRIILQTYSFH